MENGMLVLASAAPPDAGPGAGDPTGSVQPDLGVVLREYVEVTERLQQTHESLQREVQRLRDELESKDRQLECSRRLAALGELAAGVAHEVRNPLGAIRLYSDLLRGQCEEQDAALRLIEKIEAGIRAIDAVVQDTLALAPRPGRRTRQSLNEIIARARDVCRGVLARRGMSLRTTGLEHGLHVPADAEALQRVLVNLIVNAAEASQPGGEVELHVAPDEDEQRVVLRVLDQGVGLDPGLCERMFDPFFTTKAQGTGLGLSIAHRLVEAHGGTLTAGNREGGGAAFVVTLPADGAAGAEADPADGADSFSAA
jgi:two-component system sensor histidine kinase HydH